MRARVLIALAGVLCLALAAPAAGQMSVALKVFEDYATDGIIDPCKHSSEELREVQKNIPPDIDQYAPDYPASVAAALEARARGDCAGTKPLPAIPIPEATPAPTPTPTPTAVPMKTIVEAPPEPEKAPETVPVASVNAARPDVAIERVATAQPANGAPAPVLLMAILGGLLLLVPAFLLTMRRLGLAESTFHTWREAGWRFAGVWQDFRDWVRTGR